MQSQRYSSKANAQWEYREGDFSNLERRRWELKESSDSHHTKCFTSQGPYHWQNSWQPTQSCPSPEVSSLYLCLCRGRGFSSALRKAGDRKVIRQQNMKSLAAQALPLNDALVMWYLKVGTTSSSPERYSSNFLCLCVSNSEWPF